MTTLAEVILRDTAVNRPAAGTAGRLFYDTTNEKWQRDTGAAWEDCEPAAGAAGAVATDVIWDAAGDLAVGSGANTAVRLGIGTANQLLRVNAGATAPEWASVGRVLISEQTPTATGTVTFASIPGTYKNLVIEFVCRSSVSGVNTTLVCRLNNDTTDANYYIVAMAADGVAGSVFDSETALVSYVAGDTAPANSAAYGTIRLQQYAGTTFYKNARTIVQYRADNSSYQIAEALYGLEWENTAAITRIDLILGAGNFMTGSTFRLYGEF